MKIAPFTLERYFAKHEFTAKYNLTSSDCDGLMQNEVLAMADDQTKKLWDNLHLGYTESLGLPLLREEIAKLYLNIQANNVLIVSPEEGIFIALNTILEKGDHVICAFPVYQSLYSVSESIGCEVTRWMPNEDEGWDYDVDFLKKNIKSNTKLLIVNFPNNPTGFLPSAEKFKNIIAFAKEHNIYVFSDEMYYLLEHNPKDRLPSVCEIYDKSVILFGMSKTFGLAGLRIGWVVTKDNQLYNQMAEFKDFTTICSSAPGEILALIGLRAKNKIIARHLRRITGNVQLLESFFEKYSMLFSWVKPRAGTICFPKLLIKENAHDFCNKLVEDIGILILPSDLFAFGTRHIRIGYGRENMPDVLQIFEAYMTKNFI